MEDHSNLDSILQNLSEFQNGLPPVHDWNPTSSSEMDLVIRANGEWVHEGGVIHRESLVRLLASVMRAEEGGRYALVTPAERVFITVEDAPFLISDWELVCEDDKLQLLLTSNLDEQLLVQSPEDIWLSPEPNAAPCVFLRPDLIAKFSRTAYYRLADALEERDGHLGLSKSAAFLSLFKSP